MNLIKLLELSTHFTGNSVGRGAGTQVCTLSNPVRGGFYRANFWFLQQINDKGYKEGGGIAMYLKEH